MIIQNYNMSTDPVNETNEKAENLSSTEADTKLEVAREGNNSEVPVIQTNGNKSETPAGNQVFNRDASSEGGSSRRNSTSSRYSSFRDGFSQYNNGESAFSRPSSTRSNTRNRRSPPKNIDPAVVDAIVEKIVAGSAVTETDPYVLAAVVLEIENNRNMLMSSGKIRESLQQQKYLDTAKALQTSAEKRHAQKIYLAELAHKKKLAQFELEQFSKYHDQAKQELEEKLAISAQNLEAKHMKELSDFDNEWQTEAKQRQFNRLSTRLRGLRHQAQLLLLSKRFDEAEQVNKIADDCERQETQENSREMLRQFLESRKALEARQKEEHDVLSNSIVAKRQEFTSIQEKQRSVFEKRFQVLELEEKQAQDPDHVWILQRRNNESLLSKQRILGKNQAAPNKPLVAAGFGTLQLPPLQVPGSSRGRTARRT